MEMELMQETTTAKPSYSDWLRTLKVKAQSAARDEEEERRWREQFGR